MPLFFSFDNIVHHIFSARNNLSDDDIDDMAVIVREFIDIWHHTAITHLIDLTDPVKLHILAVHVIEFCVLHRCTPAYYGEQDGESLHRIFSQMLDNVRQMKENALLFVTKKLSASNF